MFARLLHTQTAEAPATDLTNALCSLTPSPLSGALNAVLSLGPDVYCDMKYSMSLLNGQAAETYNPSTLILMV